MSDRRRFVVVMNPSSAGGKALQVLPMVRGALIAGGADVEVVVSQDIPHAAEAARAAAERGDTVVALGGDGLVGALAGALEGSAPLGVLPAGRGNDFARALGIPKDPPGACRVLLTGTERTLDLGQANGRTFVCIASLGFDSDANRIANEARFVPGSLVYLWAGIRALVTWRPAHFSIAIDGRELEFDGYTVGIANTPYYGGGMKAAPDADPADGLLDVVFLKRAPKLKFLTQVLPKVFSGTHVELDEIEVHRAREVEVRADRPFDVYADGDSVTTLPVTVRLVPGALRVIAPTA